MARNSILEDEMEAHMLLNSVLKVEPVSIAKEGCLFCCWVFGVIIIRDDAVVPFTAFDVLMYIVVAIRVVPLSKDGRLANGVAAIR
jgi:hypothetical protein